MPKVPTTSRSAPKLSELAREVRAPKGIVSTGWPAVQKKCAEMGIQFRPWQPDIGRLILAKRADGKYAATVGGTGLSIPRQVGKTFLVGAIIFALCLLRPNLTVIWTAHRLRTAEETFGKMQKFAKRKQIVPHILKVVLGSGDEAIEFRNGSRILFGARERGFGRGFDQVDVVVYDEAQILTENALDDMIPATNQSRQPEGALMLFMGTPPKPADPSEVWMRMRSEALSGEDDDTGWVEFGADPKYKPTPAPAPLAEKDWRQVEKANPSFPQDTPREAIMRMRKKLGPESFLREGLGIYDEETGDGDLPYRAWLDLADPAAERGADVVFGLDLSGERDVWLSVSWRRDDGRSQVMLANVGKPLPARRAVEECVRLHKEWRGPVATSAFADELEALGVEVVDVSGPDFAAGSGVLVDAITEGTVRHGNQFALNEAIRLAKLRPPLSSGERALHLKDMPEVGPAAAAVRALWGLKNYEPMPAIY